jgi:hypothetical protein
MLRSVLAVLWTAFVVSLYVGSFPIVQAADTVPPDITNVQVQDVTDNAVTVTWDTNEDSDSLVNYGLKPDYGIVRIPGADKKSHSITLDGLEPGRTYHFRVVSSDSNGNQGISADYKVQTTGQTETNQSQQTQSQQNQTIQSSSQSQTSSQSQSQTSQQIQKNIQQIQSPQELQKIISQATQALQGITKALTIVGPPTVVAKTTSATISWTTDREADSKVLFSPSASYVDGQYQYSQASTGGATTDHSVEIIGLSPYTEYHFKVESTDSYGITGDSKDFTFRTKAVLPQIRNLRILKVQEDSATLAWDTTVPSKALVDYQDLTTGAQNSVGRPTLATNHQIKISNLTLGTRYVAYVTAENAGGDRVKSQPITFITVKDTAPPIISNVTNDSTLFPGSEVRVQTIIEWDTDEPALCTLTYHEGISAGVEPTDIQPDDKSYKQKHVQVVTDFAPSTVYQFWLTCNDEAGNSAKSENFVLFTPTQEKNIIDLILQNFESTFGWLKNIRGGGGG